MLDRLGLDTLGFQLNEIMSGTHEFEPGEGTTDTGKFEYTITWGPNDLSQWLNPFDQAFMKQDLTGSVSVDGLCDNAPCHGTLELRYFSEKKIRYRFEFEAQGSTYQYVGEKVNIRLWNLPFSHTTCFGVITEKKSGRLVSRCLSYFRIKTLLPFLLSFRVIR